jgi:hypothetical protein
MPRLVGAWDWLIGRGRWQNVSRRELQGYLLWVPTALAIAAVEILGALGWASIPWTTISTTVGHLETRWHLLAVVVVVLITLVAFLGIVSARPNSLLASISKPTGFSLTALAWDIGVIIAAVGAGLIAYWSGAPKLVRGYWIYGLFLILGIIGPSLYALIRHSEPTLFATIRSLGGRLPWFNFTLAAGMAVLAFHLAIYPWPDIAHQSTRIGGINSDDAKQIAATYVPSPDSYYKTVDRGSLANSEVWIVSFYPRDQQGPICVIAVITIKLATRLQCPVGP